MLAVTTWDVTSSRPKWNYTHACNITPGVWQRARELIHAHHHLIQLHVQKQLHLLCHAMCDRGPRGIGTCKQGAQPWLANYAGSSVAIHTWHLPELGFGCHMVGQKVVTTHALGFCNL